MLKGVYKHKSTQGFQKGHPNFRKEYRPTKETLEKMRASGTFFKKGCIPWNKKGKTKHSEGYILIYKPEHPFANHHGYVSRSHLVMESFINRYIKKSEIVHHINGDVLDDRIENLKLFNNQKEHAKYHDLNRHRNMNGQYI